jgi:hypothetical protein
MSTRLRRAHISRAGVPALIKTIIPKRQDRGSAGDSIFPGREFRLLPRLQFGNERARLFDDFGRDAHVPAIGEVDESM